MNGTRIVWKYSGETLAIDADVGAGVASVATAAARVRPLSGRPLVIPADVTPGIARARSRNWLTNASRRSAV